MYKIKYEIISESIKILWILTTTYLTFKINMFFKKEMLEAGTLISKFNNNNMETTTNTDMYKEHNTEKNNINMIILRHHHLMLSYCSYCNRQICLVKQSHPRYKNIISKYCTDRKSVI